MDQTLNMKKKGIVKINKRMKGILKGYEELYEVRARCKLRVDYSKKVEEMRR